MSFRFDSAPLIPGAYMWGDRGHGVQAEDLPSDGQSGPSYLFNCVSLPGDADIEIRGLIIEWPLAGTLFVDEYGRITYSDAPAGVHYFTFQLYSDGVAIGDVETVMLVVGEAVLAGNAESSSSSTGALVTGGSSSNVLAGIAVAASQASARLVKSKLLAGAASSESTASGSLNAGEDETYSEPLHTMICIKGVLPSTGRGFIHDGQTMPYAPAHDPDGITSYGVDHRWVPDGVTIVGVLWLIDGVPVDSLGQVVSGFVVSGTSWKAHKASIVLQSGSAGLRILTSRVSTSDGLIQDRSMKIPVLHT